MHRRRHAGDRLGLFGLFRRFDLFRLLQRLDDFRLLLFLDQHRTGFGLRQQRLGLFERHHLLAAIDGEADLAADLGVGIDGDGDAEALLELAQMRALLVEDVERDLGPRADDQIVGRRP